MRASLAALLLCGALPLAVAKEAAPVAPDPVLEARMLSIARELRCLVCQNQTIADSDAALAQDLRRQVREMLRRGDSEAQIRAYMTERYGDFVLYRPPLQASTLPLWAGPGMLLAGGALTLWLVLRRRSRLGDERFEPDADGDADDSSDEKGLLP